MVQLMGLVLETLSRTRAGGDAGGRASATEITGCNTDFCFGQMVMLFDADLVDDMMTLKKKLRKPLLLIENRWKGRQRKKVAR